jgi:hypothetical protein
MSYSFSNSIESFYFYLFIIRFQITFFLKQENFYVSFTNPILFIIGVKVIYDVNAIPP